MSTTNAAVEVSTRATVVGSTDVGCYFHHDIRVEFTKGAGRCKTLQCQQDARHFASCPLARNYTWLHDSAFKRPLSRKLLAGLKGQRVVIFGDSMARQMFSVLVGLLRDEPSFLDFHAWNPARFRLWTASPSSSSHDELDIFYRPLSCEGSHCAGTGDNEWSSVPFHADRLAPPADVDVTWIPMPHWSSVNDALSVAAASEKATNRPFSTYLVFVPAAWEFDAKDIRVPFGAFERVPSYFWETWSRWMASDEKRLLAQYGALTMPFERTNKCNGPSNTTNHLMIARHKLPHAFIVEKCGPNSCCLGPITRERNRFHYMPTTWQRVDFAALMSTEQPVGVEGGNWHYECFLTRPGTTDCAHRPRARIGLTGSCNDAFVRYLKRTTQLLVVPRENGDCAEDGNTRLWDHIMSQHPSLFVHR